MSDRRQGLAHFLEELDSAGLKCKRSRVAADMATGGESGLGAHVIGCDEFFSLYEIQASLAPSNRKQEEASSSPAEPAAAEQSSDPPSELLQKRKRETESD
eukprot:TRINITY_DN15146_c0_g2_i1.p2 TRINITY_DN15146_c0_g2~~TRINITY_DN15146_c0_g2_i1.p2  ORF type:complete len:101 (-),score=24.18 TRINITY_DN15146_c0_g2_i1:212-514(-)